MPYLQLDVPRRYPVEVKRPLAGRLGDIYADVMQTTPNKVAIAFRELETGDTFRSREISLIVFPLTKCSRRIRLTVSTVSIPPTTCFESKQAAHQA